MAEYYFDPSSAFVSADNLANLMSKLGLPITSNPASSPNSKKPSDERPGAVSDVINLFAHFGAASAATAYQEIHSDADADAAVKRWPVMAEWFHGLTQSQEQEG